MEIQFTGYQRRLGIVRDRILKTFVHHLGVLTCPDISCTKTSHTSSFDLSCVDLSVVVEKVVGCTRDGDRDDAMGGRIPSAYLGMILEVGQEQMKILDFPSELGSKDFTTLLEQACSSPRGQIKGISFIWGDMVRDDWWRNCCGSGRWRRCSSGSRRKSLDGLSQLLSSCVIHVAVLRVRNDNDEELRRLRE